MHDRSRPLSSFTFVAFDFETTGLYANTDRIVEFGAIKFMAGKELDRFQSLVNPGLSIAPVVSQVSGITDAMVKGQPLVKTVLPLFLDFVGDAILMAHNADFDLGFLRAALQEQHLPPVQNLIIDTVALAKRAMPGQKSYSLQNLAAFLQLPGNQAHRALDDSLTCMRLFLACAEALSFMGEVTLGEVIA